MRSLPTHIDLPLSWRGGAACTLHARARGVCCMAACCAARAARARCAPHFLLRRPAAARRCMTRHQRGAQRTTTCCALHARCRSRAARAVTARIKRAAALAHCMRASVHSLNARHGARAAAYLRALRALRIGMARVAHIFLRIVRRHNS